MPRKQPTFRYMRYMGDSIHPARRGLQDENTIDVDDCTLSKCGDN